jgi:hypothetical protein
MWLLILPFVTLFEYDPRAARPLRWEHPYIKIVETINIHTDARKKQIIKDVILNTNIILYIMTNDSLLIEIFKIIDMFDSNELNSIILNNSVIDVSLKLFIKLLSMPNIKTYDEIPSYIKVTLKILELYIISNHDNNKYLIDKIKMFYINKLPMLLCTLNKYGNTSINELKKFIKIQLNVLESSETSKRKYLKYKTKYMQLKLNINKLK